MTATATALVQPDIYDSPQLEQPRVFTHSFSRPNLSFWVISVNSFSVQELVLFQLLKKHTGQSGIIYASTQRAVDYLAKLIIHFKGSSISIAPYHAGLSAKQRIITQEKFIGNQLDIITATNAFGVGVDKPNIRFVIHYQVPGNLENYHQEVGRAGRDQLAADCYLLFNPADVVIQQTFISQTYPDPSHQRYQFLLHQLMQLLRYAKTDRCRQQFINTSFGETNSPPCGQCDNCLHSQTIWTEQDMTVMERLSDLVATISKRHRLEKNYILTPLLISLLTVHRPSTVEEFLKIPGIGRGWVEKWYNTISTEIEKGAIYGINSPTTRRPVP